MLTEKLIRTRLEELVVLGKEERRTLPGGAPASATKGKPRSFVCWRKDFLV